jgi:MFS family permease
LNDSLLHHRSFILFWLARVSTTVALQMQAVAVGWQMYDLTSSTLNLGLVGLAQFVPSFLLVLVAGHFADRYDRRRIAQIGEAVEALASATLAIATITGVIAPALIFTAVFTIGVGRAFEQPNLQALVPAIVPASLFPRAVAGVSSASKFATILGPAVGGVLYLISPILVYVTCGTLFLTACLLFFFVRVERTPPKREPVTLAVMFAGVAFIRRNPIVLGAISLDLFAVLFGGATALLPVFARDVFAVGPWGLGIMRAAPGIGALVMSLVLARAPLRANVGRTMFATVTIFGLATVAFALSTSPIVAIIALTIVGASDMISVVIRETLVQIQTPDEMRGRVSAVNSLFVGTSNQLGEFESGVTAAWFGTVPSVLIGGIATVLIVLLWRRLFPALFHVESFAHRDQPRVR